MSNCPTVVTLENGVWERLRGFRSGDFKRCSKVVGILV